MELFPSPNSGIFGKRGKCSSRIDAACLMCFPGFNFFCCKARPQPTPSLDIIYMSLASKDLAAVPNPGCASRPFGSWNAPSGRSPLCLPVCSPPPVNSTPLLSSLCQVIRKTSQLPPATRSLPAIARENGLQTQKEKVEPILFDYSDWPDPGRLWH